LNTYMVADFLEKDGCWKEFDHDGYRTQLL
jgi:hypothetical protein